MKRMAIHGKSGACAIAIGEPIERVTRYCGTSKPGVIVTDPQVRRAHGGKFPPFEVIEIGIGERMKTLATLDMLYGRFLELGLDRSSWVIAIGGGLVCDVAGFAASTYLRGLRFGFVPTTLLAQVDASVGGKNGINYRGYKNLIGTFTQPRFVVCDLTLLTTLDPGDVRSGYGEVIKHALIGDASLFSFLEAEWEKCLALEPDAVERAIHDSLIIKKGIVSLDEREHGERRKLNFGHTFGHALEKVIGLRHGEAISVGMVAAARLSGGMGMLTPGDVKRIETAIGNFGLPVRVAAERRLVMDAVRKDKKREGERINLVLLEGIGRARVVPVKIEDLEGVVDDLCDPY